MTSTTGKPQQLCSILCTEVPDERVVHHKAQHIMVEHTWCFWDGRGITNASEAVASYSGLALYGTENEM